MAKEVLTRNRPDAEPEQTTTQITTRERAADRRADHRGWARTSPAAVLGLMIGVAAVLATLTGLLAPVGVVLGVIGGAICAAGLASASKRSGVTGHGPAMIGMLFCLVAVALGVLAIGGQLAWLNNHTDEVARLHGWLNAHLPWIKRF